MPGAAFSGVLYPGLGGGDLSPCGWRPREQPGTFLVAGPRGSGRSNALLLIARQAAEAGYPVLAYAALPGGLAAWATGSLLAGNLAESAAATAVEAISGAGPGTLFVVGDLETLPRAAESALAARLAGRSEQPHAGRDAFACSGLGEGLAGGYSGLAPLLRAGRTGLLLNPGGPGDGEAFGPRIGAPMPRIPGRGLLLTGRDPVPLQVADAGIEADGRSPGGE